MAGKHYYGEGIRTREHPTMPLEGSDISPLPYFPNLRRYLRSHGTTMMLIYLERHHPAPQDDPKAPIRLDLGRTQGDLQLSRQGLWTYTMLISTRYLGERQRLEAVRSGREFWRNDRRNVGPLKLYSLTRVTHHVYTLRRNPAALAAMLKTCGLSQADLVAPDHGQAEIGTGQISVAIEDARDRFCENSVESGVETADLVAGGGAAAALELRKMLTGLAIVDDGRRRKGIKRAEHTRRPWTAERRAKWEATVKAKCAKKPTQYPKSAPSV